MERLEELEQRFRKEPLAKLLNAELYVFDVGHAEVCALVGDDCLIVDGPVQGGIITAVADFAGVYAAMSKLPAGHTPARNIEIHFLQPITKGQKFNACAEVLKESRSSLLVMVKVYENQNYYSDDDLIAYATMVFAKPRIDPKI